MDKTAVLKGELSLTHATGVSWAGIEIPVAALHTLTIAEIDARYVLPALTAIVERLRRYSE